MVAGAAAAQPSTVAVFAAGSLRAAMTELAAAFEKDHGATIHFSFGASGLLKDRIAAGEAADVFASANLAHPQALAAAGRGGKVQLFARNSLCLLAWPGFSLRGRTLVQRLLDVDVKLGTSTPGSDPSGDYAFELFDRIEASAAAPPGSAAVLKAKALQLTGGRDSPAPPPGRSVYGQLVSEGQVDAFVTYRTNASQAQREQPALQLLALPEAINVGADYGLTVLRPAAPAAQAFADLVLGPAGRTILVAHGFGTP